MEKALKKGFVPVMLTPFEQNGEIDYEALRRLTGFYLDAGASGLFANCLSSEMYELSGRERLRIIEQIVHDVKGAVPVVATGSFGSSTAEQADSIKKVYDKGVDAVILITGLLANARESAAVFEERVEELLDLTPGIPVGFYECPVPYKRILSPEQLGRFCKNRPGHLPQGHQPGHQKHPQQTEGSRRPSIRAL
jgi:4-hydroxy-tetrahydrodipicolinate synthase